MKSMIVVALLLSTNVAAASSATKAVSAAKAKVTPVQKVIELLKEMTAKGTSEMRKEQVQFATYKSFCDNTKAQKEEDIAEETALIVQLKAAIEKANEDAAQLTIEIDKHDKDIDVWAGDKKSATRVREIEKEDYTALHKDYSESISAIERATQTLKSQAYDRKQEAALIQVSSLRLVPEDTKKMITNFLQTREAESANAPEANAYEFQSQGVIDMLKKLGDKFQNEIIAIEKEEVTKKAYFQGLMADLESETAQATTDRTDKSATKAKKLQTAATKEGELKGSMDDKAADEAYLKDLIATCEQKAGEFIRRQDLRKEELETVKKAIEIIAGEGVAGNAAKVESMSLVQGGTALAQLRSGAAEVQVRSNVEDYLRRQAASTHSKMLSLVASHVAADPLRKVKKMIKDLIYKLVEEANEEATHKGWCDTELATNAQTRKEKTVEVESLNAEIDLIEASLTKLTEKISELTAGLAQLEINMNEATKIRVQEKGENIETINDAKESQTAVAQALTVLKEFYAKASEATAFTQRSAGAQPEIFDSAYTGMQSENGGVVGFLEVIQSDFARLEATTKAAEATAVKEYEQFEHDYKMDKEEKSTSLKHTKKMKADQEHALKRKKDDEESTQKELQSALFYYDKLKPSCIDAGVSYEDRVARRKDEIESLQSALRILNQEEIDF